jgi:hypothetical protein
MLRTAKALATIMILLITWQLVRVCLWAMNLPNDFTLYFGLVGLIALLFISSYLLLGVFRYHPKRKKKTNAR